jgi:hypothetical protein
MMYIYTYRDSIYIYVITNEAVLVVAAVVTCLLVRSCNLRPRGRGGVCGIDDAISPLVFVVDIVVYI